MQDINNDVLEMEDTADKVLQLCGEIKAFLVTVTMKQNNSKGHTKVRPWSLLVLWAFLLTVCWWFVNKWYSLNSFSFKQQHSFIYQSSNNSAIALCFNLSNCSDMTVLNMQCLRGFLYNKYSQEQRILTRRTGYLLGYLFTPGTKKFRTWIPHVGHNVTRIQWPPWYRSTTVLRSSVPVW